MLLRGASNGLVDDSTRVGSNLLETREKAVTWPKSSSLRYFTRMYPFWHKLVALHSKHHKSSLFATCRCIESAEADIVHKSSGQKHEDEP